MKGLFAFFFPILSLLRLDRILPHLGVVNLARDRRAINDTQQPDHALSNRVHVFHGTFASELEATDYCITPMGRNKPEPLTRDLPEAIINTSEVEIIFGGPRIGAIIPMLSGTPDALYKMVGSDNTIVLISEAGFCGLPYKLNDTPVLRYAGAYDVS